MPPPEPGISEVPAAPPGAVKAAGKRGKKAPSSSGDLTAADDQGMNDGDERVILVDDQDRELGTAGKLAAHREGTLHRALSVVIRDSGGRFLLQKRALTKYHSGGLWTNTCCSHPRAGEPVAAAVTRRLVEEMGIRCALIPLFTTRYHATLDSGMTEHELVHVFGGLHDGPVRPNPAEAEGYAWVEPDALLRDLEAAPERYSVWFRKYLVQHWDEVTAPAAWRRLAVAA
jgi:isopentenyl-diphosphate delta-isomerase